MFMCCTFTFIGKRPIIILLVIDGSDTTRLLIAWTERNSKKDLTEEDYSTCQQKPRG